MFSEAESLYEQSLVIRENLGDQESELYARNLNNLAVVFLDQVLNNHFFNKKIYTFLTRNSNNNNNNNNNKGKYTKSLSFARNGVNDTRKKIWFFN